MRYLIMSSLVVLVLFPAFAQESVFYTPETDSAFQVKKFGLELYNFNFIKNNEYFNHISDGYTLLGSQVQPEFIYNVTDKAQFKTGVFLMKHFGEVKIAHVIPTLSFRYKHNNHLFTLGNIYARDNHRFIEPLMASEKILSSEAVETGFQYKLNSEVLNLDIWLDWEKFIRKYDPDQEVFSLGMYLRPKLFKNLYVPVQFFYRHRGGQINLKDQTANDPRGISNTINFSVGGQYRIIHKPDRDLTVSYYYLRHNAVANPSIYPFDRGQAHYVTIGYKISGLKLLLAYYKADQFVSIKGNEMFQTYSMRSDINYFDGVPDNRYQDYIESDRNLLFAKVYYDWRITPNLKAGVQGTAFYQLNAGYNAVTGMDTQYQFDYSYGVYVILNEVFKF